MLAAIPLLGTIFSFLGGIAPAISSYFTAKVDVEGTEFAGYTTAQQAIGVEFMKAQASANASKVANNTSTAAHVMIYLFGLPTALHWGMVMVTSAFEPWLHMAVHPLAPVYAEAELKVVLSFFILAPTMAVVNGVQSMLRK